MSDYPTPATPIGTGEADGDRAWRTRPLERAESLRLLAGLTMGRVVFTEKAMPVIRPVNHLLDSDDNLIIRTHLGKAALSTLGEVVAYAGDNIDPHTHTGWSVVVIGTARQVRDRDQITRYEQLLQPLLSQRADHIIRIEPEIINGYLTGTTRETTDNTQWNSPG